MKIKQERGKETKERERWREKTGETRREDGEWEEERGQWCWFSLHRPKGFLMTFGFFGVRFSKNGEREKNNKNTSGRNFISFTWFYFWVANLNRNSIFCCLGAFARVVSEPSFSRSSSCSSCSTCTRPRSLKNPVATSSAFSLEDAICDTLRSHRCNVLTFYESNFVRWNVWKSF